MMQLKKKKKKILEIGAGTSPHLNYLNDNYSKFFLENSKFSIKHLKKNLKKIKNFCFTLEKIYHSKLIILIE